MRNICYSICFILCFTQIATANEGMWTPSQLPEVAEELSALGLEMDPKELSSLTKHPMNAIVSLGNCSASFVSPNGLVITNHHCAYGDIQYNSTDDNNLLANGFYAENLQDELAAASTKRVYVTTDITDVTSKITNKSDNLTGKARFDAIETAQKELVADCEASKDYRCQVYEFHGGLSYQLIKRLAIRDVRLVYAPPESIGKFGGDIDNWMWPRHTGDFAFLRAYVSPNGKPADYNPDNVPYQSKSYLKINNNGLNADDFAMVIGYPGRTYRYRVAQEADFYINWIYPTLIEQYQNFVDIIENNTKNNKDAEIKYASQIAGTNNYLKNFKGMLEGFSKNNVIVKKQAMETELQHWLKSQNNSKQDALNNLEKTIEKNNQWYQRNLFFRFVKSEELFKSAITLYRLAQEREKPDLERKLGYQDRDIPMIKGNLEKLEKNYDASVERVLWEYQINQYLKQNKSDRIQAFDQFFGFKDNTKHNQKQLHKKLNQFYKKTKLYDLDNRLKWLKADIDAFKQSKDPFIQLAIAIYDENLALEQEQETIDGLLSEQRPTYLKDLIAYKSNMNQAVYPDANSSLRVTFGKVIGYQPKDAVIYQPFTTLNGIMEKYTGTDPFDSPQSQLDAIKQKNYGQYQTSELNSVPVNFLTNLDIIGGNSGSPTLNKNAELIGLAFDMNWESINSSWLYSSKVSRCIHVDIRYMLWIMERLDKTERLLQEMDIVN